MLDEPTKAWIDYTAGVGTFAVVMGWVSQATAVLALIWFVIRIWESATARRLLRAVCERCAQWWDRQ